MMNLSIQVLVSVTSSSLNHIRFSAVNTNQNSALPPLNMLMLCSANQPLRITLKATTIVVAVTSASWRILSDYHIQLKSNTELYLSQEDHKDTTVWGNTPSTIYSANNWSDLAFHCKY